MKLRLTPGSIRFGLDTPDIHALTSTKRHGSFVHLGGVRLEFEIELVDGPADAQIGGTRILVKLPFGPVQAWALSAEAQLQFELPGETRLVLERESAARRPIARFAASDDAPTDPQI